MAARGHVAAADRMQQMILEALVGHVVLSLRARSAGFVRLCAVQAAVPRLNFG
jgi:hypothetical protein